MHTVDQPVTLEPSPEILDAWAAKLIPAQDVWYRDAEPNDLDLQGCVVLTREEYQAHPTFQDIHFANAYCHWQMSPEVTHVIVSDPDWLPRLDTRQRDLVLDRQVALKRGLVFPIDWFDAIPRELDRFVSGEQVVLCREAWNLVSPELRHTVLRKEMKRWDDFDCLPMPPDAPEHVRAIANTFIPQEGTNCFAIAAYGATGDTGLLSTWFMPHALHEWMAANDFRELPNSEPIADDIVTFEREGNVIHGAWCAGHDRFLNKNGQSMFNPVRIVDWHTLSHDWQDTNRMLYRRGAP